MTRFIINSSVVMKSVFGNGRLCVRNPLSFSGANRLISSNQSIAFVASPALRWLQKGYHSQSRKSDKTYTDFTKLFVFNGVLTFFGLGKKEEEKESELILTIKRSILLLERGELKKAEQMLHIALKLAQEQQNVEGITYIYDLMANLAYETGEFNKAEKLFVSVIQRELATGVQQNDNKIIHISLKLASIYKETGDIKKAEEGFKFCKNLLQQKIKEGTKDEDTLLLWAMTLDWYAHFALDRGLYSEALDSLKRAYEMSLAVNGQEHEQNVVLLNDLGTICCLQNNYDEAIQYLKEAVHIGKKLSTMEDIASIYVNLGTVYMKKMMLDEAKQACQEGWRSAKKMNNKEALDEASICLNELRIKQP